MKLRLCLVLWSCLMAILAGCRHAGPRFDPYMSLTELPGGYSTNILFNTIQRTNHVDSKWLTPPEDFFRLGPGDVVEIEILGEPESAATVLVGPDGKLYYSLLPGTFVWGLTLAEAKTLLEESLTKYIRVQPEVALTLRGVASKRIWILGNVQLPGVYTLATPMTILEAVSAAGGMLSLAGSSQELADLRKSFIMRDGEFLPVDLDQLFHKGDMSQNIYLQPGDYIYVRPAIAHDIYILGAVRAPNIVPHAEKASVVSAIASAGGPVPYAYMSHVAILRGSLSNPSIAVVDYTKIVKGKAPDVRLEPGDVVYVPYAPYMKLAQFADVILTEFVRTVALNEGRNAVLDDAEPVGVSVGSGTIGTPASSAPTSTPISP